MRILIGINTLTEINQLAYVNHLNLFFRLGRNYPKIDFGICAPHRMSIDNMRNFVAKAAIEGKFDYIWFIDDDVLLNDWNNSLQYLLNLKADVAAGITLIRGFPYEPMLFSFAPDRKTPYLSEYREIWGKTKTLRSPLLEAVGFSCCLIRTSIIEKMEAPYFMTLPNCTEDVFFCQRAKYFVPNLSLAATGFVETSHILSNEIIFSGNREAKMRYDRAIEAGFRKRPKKSKGIILSTQMMGVHNGRAQLLKDTYAPKA